VVWKFWPSAQHTSTPTPETKGVVAETIAAPQSFTDFVGEITTINSETKHLSVVVGLPDAQGTVTPKTYDIAVGPTTILRQQATTKTGQSISSIKFSQFAVKQRVHVYSTADLHPISSFTPTSIYFIKN
jgi:hypothetical protein